MCHQKHLRLIPPVGPLTFVSMDLLWTHTTTRRGHKHVLLITYKYSKLSKVVPMNKTQAPKFTEAFLDSCNKSFGLSNFVLTRNGPKFIAQCSSPPCAPQWNLIIIRRRPTIQRPAGRPKGTITQYALAYATFFQTIRRRRSRMHITCRFIS